jgi:formyltetrahydrofolate-dependent phosphoribosylglycinamide formyltransferase
MVKLIGKNKIKTAVFISGAGSNLKNLIKFSRYDKSPIQINCIISDNKNAKGLIYAEKFKNEKKILKYLKKNRIFLICLAGFMKILSKNFIKKFNGKILNIHPSLLPKYKGLNTHQRAIDNNEKFSGCTVHFVNSKLDSGKIILQKKVKILKNDNSKILAKKILKDEHILYPKAIMKVFSNL